MPTDNPIQGPPAEYHPTIHAVKGCARCGHDHDDLHYKRFVNPIYWDNDIVYEWWATCPLTGDPILMTAIPDGMVMDLDTNKLIPPEATVDPLAGSEQ